MSSSEVLAEAEAKVAHLLRQYHEYLAVSQAIDQLKDKQMKRAIELGAVQGVPFSTILKERPAEIVATGEDIEVAEQNLQRISDEMTFTNPVVWMMYKFKAYAGTSQAITDMADFRKHCSKPGYICTKRYRFLNQQLHQYGIDLNDSTKYPDDMSLEQAYGLPALVALAQNDDFMVQWNRYEYNLDNDRVAKWENAYPETTL